MEKGETMNKKDIKALIEDINVTLLPSGELLVDTKYANEAKSVRLMDREGFTRVFEEPKTGKWVRITKGLTFEKYACSICGRQIEDEGSGELLFIKYPYCHCGAKMERSKE